MAVLTRAGTKECSLPSSTLEEYCLSIPSEFTLQQEKLYEHARLEPTINNQDPKIPGEVSTNVMHRDGERKTHGAKMTEAEEGHDDEVDAISDNDDSALSLPREFWKNYVEMALVGCGVAVAVANGTYQLSQPPNNHSAKSILRTIMACLILGFILLLVGINLLFLGIYDVFARRTVGIGANFIALAFLVMMVTIFHSV